MAACPRCGGSDRRPLAPNFFECETQVLSDVVPRGVQGNPTDVPLYGPCGHRYQEEVPIGGAKCFCGMFAVGECRECDRPLCGDHGGRYGRGAFLCYQHGLEARQRETAAREEAERAAASAQSARHEQELAEAREAIKKESAARYAAAPGFPTAPATGPELAAALERLVPMKKDQLLVRRGGLFRSDRYVSGWVFILDRKSFGENLVEMSVLIVMADGRVFLEQRKVVGGWRPEDITYLRGSNGPVDTLGEGQLKRVLDQVLNWLGVLDECSVATLEQHHIVITYDEWAGQTYYADEIIDQRRRARTSLRG